MVEPAYKFKIEAHRTFGGNFMDFFAFAIRVPLATGVT
jgi:hypothetical protein